jgi:hypothetical protein
MVAAGTASFDDHPDVTNKKFPATSRSNSVHLPGPAVQNGSRSLYWAALASPGATAHA